ncbi:hypothetical protein Mgra_00004898 [Meloidogyne graminicola]|uniref:Uncharacterized protein n=1 Tax=Meloidogyne graminicola TaxID=189291 RepID=A0A8S9ZQB6_9BILA|nr:hypothetical protein Mgra_00004898 [Meloidogyne graminicola]
MIVFGIVEGLGAITIFLTQLVLKSTPSKRSKIHPENILWKEINFTNCKVLQFVKSFTTCKIFLQPHNTN